MAAPGKDGGKYYEITVGRTKVYLDEASLPNARKALLLGLAKPIKRMIALNKSYQDEIAEYYKAADVQNGLAQAVAHAMIIQIGRVQYPDQKIVGEANQTCEQLSAALGKANLERIYDVLPDAERALNALNQEMGRFGREMAGKALVGSVVFSLTAAAGFAVVGHVIAAKIVAAEVVAASAGTIQAGVQAGMAAINTAAGDLGSYTAGEGGSVKGTIWNMAVDSLTSLMTAGIASKIKPKYFDDLAKKLAGKLASKAGIDSAVMVRMLQNYFSSTGQETVKSAAGEVAGLMGKGFKSGRAPTKEDFDEAMTKVLTTALTAGFLNEIGRTQKAILVQSREAVKKTTFDKAMQDLLGKGGVLPDKERMKIWAEVWGKVEEQVVQGAVNTAFKEAKVVDSKPMLDTAKAYVEKNSAVYDEVKAATRDALKKRKLLSGSSNMV